MSSAPPALDYHPLVPEPKPQKWLVPNWIPDHCVTVLSGPGGSGKSRLTLQLLLHIAAGRPHWLPGSTGLDTPFDTPRKVIYIHSEDNYDQIANRIPRNDLADWCRDTARTFRSFQSPEVLWHVQDNHGSPTAVLERLKLDIERLKVKAIVLDPAAALFDGEENYRRHVRSFMQALNRIAASLDCSIILIMHPAKQNPKAPVPGPSGSTDWTNSARSVIDLANDPSQTDSQPRAVLKLIKTNYGPFQPDLHLKGFPFFHYTE